MSKQVTLKNGKVATVRRSKTYFGDRVFEARVDGRLFGSAYVLRDLLCWLARQ